MPALLRIKGKRLCNGTYQGGTVNTTCNKVCVDQGDRGDGVHTYECPDHGVQYTEYPTAHTGDRRCPYVTGTSTSYTCPICGQTSNTSGHCDKVINRDFLEAMN